MPRFRSTQNILKDNLEHLYENILYNEKLELPPLIPWDNSRELSVEDVDLWEVLSEYSGGTGLYASWLPYADFYMIVYNGSIDSTYYGNGSDVYAANRCKELNIYYPKKW